MLNSELKHRKPAPKKGKSNGNKQLKVFVLGAAGLGALLYFGLAKTDKVPILGKVETAKVDKPKVKSAAIEQLETNEAPSTVAVSTSVSNLRKSTAAAGQYGLETVDAKIKGGKVELSIELVRKTIWCQAGDWDTIRRFVGPASSALLLSVEGMDQQFKAVSVALNAQEIAQGITKTISVPATANSNIGVFLCSDFGEKKSCAGKSALTSKKLDELMLDEKAKASNAPPTDQIFYFQNLLLKSGKLSAYNRNMIAPQDLPKLAPYLKTAFNLSDQSVKNSETYAGKMRSGKLEIKPEKITIELTGNDPRCVR